MQRPLVTMERRRPDADVLVVTSGWPTDENETYCIFVSRQVDSLAALGVHADVLFVRGYRSALAYPLTAIRLMRWSLGRRHRYRLVHAQGGEAALAARFYWRAPLLVSYLGTDLLGFAYDDGKVARKRRLRTAMIRQHSRLASATITQSAEMEDTLPASARPRNTVLSNGVDVDLFAPAVREDARRELGWDEHARIALFAANPAVALKRFRLAEAAVDHARRDLPDLELKVACGQPPDRIPLFMNAADCLIFTSASEGSPNVVKEAMLCNLPVVSTPVADVPEMLAGVTPSYLCDSELALSKALVECLREPRRSNGRTAASPRFDGRIVAEALVARYEALAPGVEGTTSRLAGAGG
jgi:glycosyltransferase involved in cell wall biosynthesis